MSSCRLQGYLCLNTFLKNYVDVVTRGRGLQRMGGKLHTLLFNLMFLLILVLLNRHAQQTNKIHFVCAFIVQLHGHQLPNAENACSMDH